MRACDHSVKPLSEKLDFYIRLLQQSVRSVVVPAEVARALQEPNAGSPGGTGHFFNAGCEVVEDAK